MVNMLLNVKDGKDTTEYKQVTTANFITVAGILAGMLASSLPVLIETHILPTQWNFVLGIVVTLASLFYNRSVTNNYVDNREKLKETLLRIQAQLQEEHKQDIIKRVKMD